MIDPRSGLTPEHLQVLRELVAQLAPPTPEEGARMRVVWAPPPAAASHAA